MSLVSADNLVGYNSFERIVAKERLSHLNKFAKVNALANEQYRKYISQFPDPIILPCCPLPIYNYL